MTKFKSIIILIIFQLIFIDFNHSRVLNWDKIGLSWDIYKKNGCRENFQNLYNLLPDAIYEKEIKSTVRDKIVNDLFIIEDRIKRNDIFALKIAFRLINISDGFFTEELCIIVGNLIKIYPLSFIKELKVNFLNMEAILVSVLTNMNSEILRNKECEIKELILRIKALNSIKDSKYKSIKEICINAIKNELEIEYNYKEKIL